MAQAKAQAQEKAQDTSELLASIDNKLNELDTINELKKDSSVELPEKYIKFSYSNYRINGEYKLMFKLEKKKQKLNSTSYTRECDYKSELASEKMLNELKTSEQNGYKLIFNNAISELAYRKSELQELSSELKSEKLDDKHKSELEQKASELLTTISELFDKQASELQELKNKLNGTSEQEQEQEQDTQKA